MLGGWCLRFCPGGALASSKAVVDYVGPKTIPIPVSRGPYDRGPRSGRGGPPGGSSGPEGGGGGGSAGVVSAYYIEGLSCLVKNEL